MRITNKIILILELSLTSLFYELESLKILSEFASRYSLQMIYIDL